MSAFFGRSWNVKNCVAFLKSIGVEVSPEAEQSWLDTEKVDRLCVHMKKAGKTAYLWECANGHSTLRVRVRGARRMKVGDGCAECEAALTSGQLWWVVTVDGTLRDYRPQDERWRQLEDVDSL